MIKGATDFLVEPYGQCGMLTRAMIGCTALAANNAVEIILTVAYSGSDVRTPLTREPPWLVAARERSEPTSEGPT